MEEKQNWLTIAAVVLVIAGLGVFLYRQSRQQPEEIETPSDDQVAEQRADEFLETLNVDLPEDADRVNLRDVTGGQAAGVATRREAETGTTTQSLLVALPEPEAGVFYEAYLQSEVEEAEPIYLGKLRSVKGGWMLDYQLTGDETGYTQVQVTRETTDDRQPEEVILEGEFEANQPPTLEETESSTETENESGS